MSDYVHMFVGDVFLAIAVTIGLFLLWLGSVVAGTADTSGGYDWGAAIKSFGMLLLTLAFYLGALLRNEMDKTVRMALLVCGTLLILFLGYWAGFWMWGFF